MIIDDFESLKRNVEEAKRKHDQHEGIIQVLKSKMKKEYGCSSIEELKKLLDKLLEEELELHRELDKKMKEFKSKFQKYMDE